MHDGVRTPLGEMLATLRRQLGLSQQNLAERTVEMARHHEGVGPVSLRTINSLERPVTAKSALRRPRRDTAHSIAVALGLSVNSPGYRAFMDTAQHPTDTASPLNDSSARPASTFIEAGREQAVQHLARVLDDATHGMPRVVLVRGEFGVGKSALIAHACGQARGRHPSAVVLWASPQVDDPPHGAFRRLIRLMLGDIETSETIAKLSSANAQSIVARAGGAAEALAAQGPLLLATSLQPGDIGRQFLTRLPDRQVATRLERLAVASPDDSLRQVSGCEQMFRVLDQYASAGPIIVVVDDLHLADAALLAELDYLINRMHQRRDLPLAIVLAVTPEQHLEPTSTGLAHLIERVQRLFAHGMIDLTETLSDAAARAFATEALRESGLPTDAATVEALVSRTAGMPMHITGLVNELRELGTDDSNVRTHIASVVPAALADTLSARVARLPDDMQRILVDASVLGTDFHAETLMLMHDLPLERFIDLVDRRLCRVHGLMSADGSDSIGGRVMHTYRFRPPLLRDALYSRLSDLQLTHAHGRAADALVELHGDAQHPRLDRLAHHLERAGRLDEAARAYLKAGEFARVQRDFDEARKLLTLCSQLESHAGDPEIRIRTLVALGLCERSAGDPDAAKTYLLRALDLTSSWNDELLRAATLEALGMVHFDTGDMRQGRHRISEAIDIWAAHDHPATSRSLANLSYLYYGLGRYEEAIASAERGRREATRTRQTSYWIDGTIGLANCWTDIGRYARAAELYHHAVQVGTELGDVHRLRICWINLALIAIERGDWGSAEAAIDQIDKHEDPISSAMESMVAFQRGLIAEGRGNGSIAHEYYRHAQTLRDSKGHAALAIDAVAGELRIVLSNDDREEASALLADLERRLEERVSDQVDGVEHPGRLYVTLIEAARLLGQSDRARHHAHAAVTLLTDRSAHVPAADREHFFSGVPSHRRILQLAAELGAISG